MAGYRAFLLAALEMLDRHQSEREPTAPPVHDEARPLRPVDVEENEDAPAQTAASA